MFQDRKMMEITKVETSAKKLFFYDLQANNIPLLVRIPPNSTTYYKTYVSLNTIYFYFLKFYSRYCIFLKECKMQNYLKEL